LADLTPAWLPYLNAGARSPVRNTLFRRSFVGVASLDVASLDVASLAASVEIWAQSSAHSLQSRH
jgi:hypothetical protein